MGILLPWAFCQTWAKCHFDFEHFIILGHFVTLGIISFGHFITLGILSYLGKMSFGHFDFGHFVILGHFVTLGIISYNRNKKATTNKEKQYGSLDLIKENVFAKN